MFQLEQVHGIPMQVVVHGRYGRGRLVHPYDHERMLDPNGYANGLGGFFDVLKNFGSGVVKAATLGIYDPNKNRFYVPFTGGQIRNWAQGVTNTATLGLVKTDKFFNSQTMRTVGNIGAGVAAAATAYAVGGWAYDKLTTPAITGSAMNIGAGGSPIAAPAGGSIYSSAIGPSPGTGAPMPSSVIPSGGNVLEYVGKGLDVLNKGSQVLSTGAKLVGGGQPMVAQTPEGFNQQIIVGDPIIGGAGGYQPIYQTPDGSVLPISSPGYFPVASGSSGGGYGGYVPAEMAMADGGMMAPVEGGLLSGGIMPWVVVGGGAFLLLMLLKKK